MAHVNGVESSWSMLRRAHQGTFHKMSPKHLNRYVQECAGKHNIRGSGALDQTHDTVLRLLGHALPCQKLVSDNGLPSGVGSQGTSVPQMLGSAKHPATTGGGLEGT